MIDAFLDCALDRERFELRRAGRTVKIEPKVFDVLVFLLDRRERVVTKQELLDALWPGEAVSESVLPRCIAAARRALGDERATPRAIQTVHGRGYRFVAAVEIEGAQAGGAPSALTLPARLRLATAEANGLPRGGGWPFVGRDAAMRRVESAQNEVIAGRGRVVLLVGEPGIGKTRALEEASEAARTRGMRVLAGRCHEGDGAPSFWPWIQILRAALADVPDDALAALLGAGASDVAELVPELHQRMASAVASRRRAGSAGAEGASPTGADEQARFRLFDGIAGFLRRMAARQPLVVSIDDLHWGDAATLRLFEFAASEWRDAAILLVGTYRDVEVRRDHPLAASLGALARLAHGERIALRGLASDDVARLLATTLPERSDAGLADAVYEMTDGNPFFLHELVRWLAESEAPLVRDASGAWSLALPQSVRDAVGRRLDRLSLACNAMLRAAAVLGRECTGALLARVAAQADDELLESLGEALAAHVLVEQRESPGRYAFSHALVQQTLYEELSVVDRVRLHRRAAEALVALAAADPDAHAGLVAHHWFEASPTGALGPAIDWTERAAQRAYELRAYEESARLYERAAEALALAGDADGARRVEMHLAAGEAHDAAGSRARAREHGRIAAQLARELGRTDLFARAAIDFRGPYENGLPGEPETEAIQREALAAIGDGAPELRARLLARLAGARFDMDEREALSSEAIALARASADGGPLREALAARWWATLGPDRLADRDAVADEILASAERLHDARMALLGYECRLGAHLLRGESPGVVAAIDAYWERAEELRQPAFRFLARVLRGGFALCVGRFAEAEALYQEAVGLGRGSIPFAEMMFGAQVLWLGYQRGDDYDPARARDFFDGLGARYPSVSVLARCARDSFLARIGDASARVTLEALGRDAFRDLPRDENWLLTMELLGDMALALDDRERAEAVGERLAPYRDLFVVHDLVRATTGSVESALGDVALTLRRADDAIACFGRAAEREAAAGFEPSRVSSLVGLATGHALRGRRGDARRSEELLAEAEAGCAAIGSRAFPRLRDRFTAFTAQLR